MILYRDPEQNKEKGKEEWKKYPDNKTAKAPQWLANLL